MCLSKEEESTIGKNCGFASKLLFILILREDGFWYRKKRWFRAKAGPHGFMDFLGIFLQQSHKINLV